AASSKEAGTVMTTRVEDQSRAESAEVEAEAGCETAARRWVRKRVGASRGETVSEGGTESDCHGRMGDVRSTRGLQRQDLAEVTRRSGARAPRLRAKRPMTGASAGAVHGRVKAPGACSSGCGR